MIYTIPTSSASSERSWSIHDFIHTKRRNRLDARRVEKFVFVYCNAGNKDAKANIFYRNEDESESGDDVEEEEDAAVGVDDDSEGASSESADEFNDSNYFSYDGSEEQKFEF
ncbi:hypothetical protein PR003_g12630 [Phytophthora rubi]|uniref:HAT C-terminal dimerisation domain-containing protein n=1 Tax=Phytophthora rubi TaxID=129364 RepID=A0A6A3M080_9STRA|nr:hypothetical protein PR002_g11174 [Phytophthora rubi]KAE9034876.1 hypothetical protein PR001_g9554 [Phytophthora rubi]KAE9336197.1 hypothetical protein PR003_g12630 [Phytophthora rubi]